MEVFINFRFAISEVYLLQESINKVLEFSRAVSDGSRIGSSTLPASLEPNIRPVRVSGLSVMQEEMKLDFPTPPISVIKMGIFTIAEDQYPYEAVIFDLSLMLG